MPSNGSSSFAAPPSARILFIPPQFHSMTAGAGAGLVSSIVTCPLDVVKTRLQAQAASVNHKDYQTVEMIIKDIWRSGGFRGFYRGLGPTLAGYLPTWGIYFTVYDMVKDKLGAWAAHNGELLRRRFNRRMLADTRCRSTNKAVDGAYCSSNDSRSHRNVYDQPFMGNKDSINGSCSVPSLSAPCCFQRLICELGPSRSI